MCICDIGQRRLHRKYAQQAKIDYQSLAERRHRHRIHGLGHPDIADETDRVEERGKEDGVTDDAVEKNGHTFHDLTSWSLVSY